MTTDPPLHVGTDGDALGELPTALDPAGRRIHGDLSKPNAAGMAATTPTPWTRRR
jgi:hypothetical protein